MINALVNGILKLATFILSLIFTPLNNYITQNIPQVDSALTMIGNFFNLAGQYAGWARDSMFIEPDTMALIIVVMGIRLSVPILVSGIKLLAKWWDTIVA